MRLSDEDREALVDALYLMLCEHGWGDHYNCGGPDEPMCGKEWAERESIAEIFDAVIAPALFRQVAAALNEAEGAVDAVRSAYIANGGEPDLLPAAIPHAERAGYLQGLRSAARIVRNLAANDSP